MNSKIVSVLLLLIVAIGFSGAASAATMQKLVTPEVPAWDEQVLVSPAYNETIPAVTHTEQRLVSEAGYQFLGHEEVVTPIGGYSQMIQYLSNLYPGWNWIHHPSTEYPAVYEEVVVVDVPEQIIHHDAVYETVIVVDQEAYDEEVSVEADHNGYTLNAAKQVQQKHGKQPINAQFYSIGTVKNGYKVVDDVGCGVNHIWVPVFNTEIVHHDAITHEEQVLVSEAYDEVIPAVTHVEQRLVSEAYMVWHADVYDWVDAVYEEVVVVDVPEQVIEHPAVYETVHHPAIPAVYETVEIPDVKKTEVLPGIPMEPTGASAAGIAFAALALLIGGGILVSRRK